jgi:hypothetical protein
MNISINQPVVPSHKRANAEGDAAPRNSAASTSSTR